MSATEWIASASSEAAPVTAKPTNLAIAIPKLAASAASTAFRSPPALTQYRARSASERCEAAFEQRASNGVTEATRPGAVRIDDFADPQFSPEVREMLAAIEPLAEQVDLTPASLMDQARAETGLDDFGPTDFVERLDVYCTALRDEAGLSPLGCFNNQQPDREVAAATGCSSRTSWPAIPRSSTSQIAAPIVICGLPRTGTTHLHNLISADPALRSLPYWESLEPVLPDESSPHRASPTRASSAPRWASTSWTRPCRTSSACTR